MIKYISALLILLSGVQSASAKHWPSKSLMKKCSVDLTQMKDGWKKQRCLKLSKRLP